MHIGRQVILLMAALALLVELVITIVCLLFGWPNPLVPAIWPATKFVSKLLVSLGMLVVVLQFTWEAVLPGSLIHLGSGRRGWRRVGIVHFFCIVLSIAVIIWLRYLGLLIPWFWTGMSGVALWLSFAFVLSMAARKFCGVVFEEHDENLAREIALSRSGPGPHRC